MKKNWSLCAFILSDIIILNRCSLFVFRSSSARCEAATSGGLATAPARRPASWVFILVAAVVGWTRAVPCRRRPRLLRSPRRRPRGTPPTRNSWWAAERTSLATLLGPRTATRPTPVPPYHFTLNRKRFWERRPSRSFSVGAVVLSSPSLRFPLSGSFISTHAGGGEAVGQVTYHQSSPCLCHIDQTRCAAYSDSDGNGMSAGYYIDDNEGSRLEIPK